MLLAYLSRLLEPYREEVAALRTEIEDLRRRAENHNRIGTVAEVDAAKGLIKVSHGDNTSPWIKFMQPSAGGVRETRVPAVGEQSLLINYGGGDGSAHSAALCGLPSDAFPPVSDRPELHRRVYKDGTEQSYDDASHTLDWKNGPTTIKADQSSIELMCGDVGFTIDAGGFHLVAPKVDHNGVNIGLDHTHDDTAPLAGAKSGMVTK
ncbi:phage baseplate assembly protein V (plasmid) [Pseudomonas sp. B26140]|uniref:phage baseplate assembly protein V n=1 Tax=Pseudomonas sp. B26140 TaxID=3235112 RepID=UPI003784AB60